MHHSNTQYPARLLFTAVASAMGDHGVTVAGPIGLRAVSACTGGHFTGPRLSGSVVAEHGNDWLLASATDPALCLVEGLLTLSGDGGETVLATYRGRRSERYGDGRARVGMYFEAGTGALDWLNDLHAVAYVETVGSDLHFTVHELLGRPADDSIMLAVEPLYRMSGSGSIGKRYSIQGQVADRYLSMAEQGCAMQGQLSGAWLKGFSWGPHRTGEGAGTFPWQIDMRVAMRTDDGTAIVQHYMGAIARELVSIEPDADRSWRTTAIYETAENGPLAWLNGILAIGIGWKEGNEAHYLYYVVT